MTYDAREIQWNQFRYQPLAHTLTSRYQFAAFSKFRVFNARITPTMLYIWRVMIPESIARFLIHHMESIDGFSDSLSATKFLINSLGLSIDIKFVYMLMIQL